MPYINKEDRKEMSEAIEQLFNRIHSKGDLNYVICELVGKVILRKERMSYTSISETIDAVHDAETELRRRILEPYENIKIEENGDVESFKKILMLIKAEQEAN